MMDAALKAFDRWEIAKALLREVRESEGSAIRDLAQAHDKVRDAAREVCVAMDRWYEWKRMNGPQDPGK